MLSLRRASMAAVAVSALFVTVAPLPSLAAPNRQAILNHAMASVAGSGSVAANGDLRVIIQLRGARAADPSGSMDLTFNVLNRLQSSPEDTRGDARLTLKSAAFKTAMNGVPVSGSVSGNGASIESRIIGKTLYLRISNVTDEMQEGASSMGWDLRGMQGRWIAFPASMLQLSNQLPFLMPVSPTVSGALRTGGSVKNPLSIAKLEKTWTDESGHSLFRARLGMSAAIKKSLKNTDVVAEVDATTSAITRLEIGSASSQPIKSCAKNAAGKQTCRNAGTLSIHWNGGFTIMPDGGLAIAPPTPEGVVSAAGR